ncbi:GAP family protein [uncultured Ramlibacter sp.]|uniref:GAP family protein n=1 Tax=uncultured Ramlibacter sp. TaxID=260755 RepID=UPI0026205ACC|nr:GAP family protein [uncultured Ramlibacter sp.]
MLETIGDLLPLAVATSLSPLPVIAMIILLTSSHARSATPAFLVGWMAAIAAAVVGFALLSELGMGQRRGGVVGPIVKLVVGFFLLALAWWQWRQRPEPGEVAQLPRWLEAAQRMGPLQAAGLGFIIYAANPKNLAVGLAAGVVFGSADLPLRQAAFVCAFYVLAGAVTVIVPVVGYLVAEQRVRPMLGEMRAWLTQNNFTLMAALLLVIGALMVGKGISGLGAALRI